MTSVVLDASALIAFLRGEPGAEVVRHVIAGSSISAVNYSEVLKKTIEVGGMAGFGDAQVGTLTINVVPFDEQQARSAERSIQRQSRSVCHCRPGVPRFGNFVRGNRAHHRGEVGAGGTTS